MAALIAIWPSTVLSIRAGYHLLEYENVSKLGALLEGAAVWSAMLLGMSVSFAVGDWTPVFGAERPRMDREVTTIGLGSPASCSKLSDQSERKLHEP